MKKNLQLGQNVDIMITRSGGKKIAATGKILKFHNKFGRDDVLVKGGKIKDQFIINAKHITPSKATKTPKN